MNTFYNLNTNFVRIYGDLTSYIYISLFSFVPSITREKAPYPSPHLPLDCPHNWQRLKALFNDLNSKKFNNVEKATNVSEFLLPLLNDFKFKQQVSRSVAAFFDLFFSNSDLSWSRAFRCRRGVRSELKNRTFCVLSSCAIVACREVLSVTALIATKGCDNVCNECEMLTCVKVKFCDEIR